MADADPWAIYYAVADELSTETNPLVLEQEWSVVDNSAVASAILLNNSCPQHILDEVCFVSSKRSRSSWAGMCMNAVAAREQNTDSVWEALVSFGSAEVVKTLARNSSTPSDILVGFARRRNARDVLRAVAGNPSLPYSELVRFLRKHCPAHGDNEYTDFQGLTYITNALQRSDLSVSQQHEILAIGLGGLVDGVSWRIIDMKEPYVNAWVKAIAHKKLRDTPSTVHDALFDLLWEHGERKSFYRVIEGLQVLVALSDVSVDRLTKVWEAYSTAGNNQLESVVELVLENPACPSSVLLNACSSPHASLRSIAANHPDCPEEGKITGALLSLG